MELAIDVNKLAQKDPLRLSKAGDSLHKICSRYLGYLTEKMVNILRLRAISRFQLLHH